VKNKTAKPQTYPKHTKHVNAKIIKNNRKERSKRKRTNERKKQKTKKGKNRKRK